MPTPGKIRVSIVFDRGVRFTVSPGPNGGTMINVLVADGGGHVASVSTDRAELGGADLVCSADGILSLDDGSRRDAGPRRPADPDLEPLPRWGPRGDAPAAAPARPQRGGGDWHGAKTPTAAAPGRKLFGYAKDCDGLGRLRQLGQSNGYPSKILDWTADQVAHGYQELNGEAAPRRR
jgi:hypothetical protein